MRVGSGLTSSMKLSGLPPALLVWAPLLRPPFPCLRSVSDLNFYVGDKTPGPVPNSTCDLRQVPDPGGHTAITFKIRK